MQSVRSRALIAHATTVVVLVILFLAMYSRIDPTNTGPTASVGLLLPYLPLFVLGLPWSLSFWNDPYAYDGVASHVRLLVVLGPAMLNVVVHGLIRCIAVVARRVHGGTPGHGG
ncbi:hypothetical protein [Micromonospora palomenae]|uniref:hypothetical protein n=1 Tax=Micromonospora palomenae TaxID=1461247 RepID=UPI0012B7B392|nr:hypothetical protein [Micromonospora palomenae]